MATFLTLCFHDLKNQNTVLLHMDIKTLSIKVFTINFKTAQPILMKYFMVVLGSSRKASGRSYCHEITLTAHFQPFLHATAFIGRASEASDIVLLRGSEKKGSFVSDSVTAVATKR